MENRNNGLVQMMLKFPSVVTVSLLWVVASIPVVTVGAANCGLYYAVNQAIVHDRDSVGRAFWRGFRRDFRQATPCWLVALAFGLLFGVDYRLTGQWENSRAKTCLIGLFVILMLVLCMMALYLFPYIARFTNPTRQCLSNTVRLALWQFPKSVLLTAVFLLAAAVCIFFFPGFLLLPGVYGLLQNRLLEPVFQKIMSEEDRALEEELNAEYDG